MQSPDSTTVEPVAVQQNGHLNSVREAADAIVAEFDEFLDWPLTVQRVCSIASGDFNNTVARHSSMSKEERDSDKCRTTAIRSYASDVAGVGQHEKYFAASDTSESCKVSWRGDASEKEARERGASESSFTEDNCRTELHNLSPPFVESLYSLDELDLAYERASEALNQEKQREDNISNVVAEHRSKVSKLIYRFQSVSRVPLSDVITHNGDLRRSVVFTEDFEKRLYIIKSYVSQVCNEAERQENRRSPVIQVLVSQPEFKSSHPTLNTNSDEECTMRETSYTIRRANISARKSRNTVVHQWNVMSTLCDIAERFVCKAEISRQLILNCLKNIVKSVTAAVVTCTVNEKLLRGFDSNIQSLPALRNASSVTAQWTLKALQYAERAMDLHRDACGILRFARWDLEAMRECSRRGTTVVNDVMAAGDRLVDLVLQPNVNFAEIMNLKLHMKMMRSLLMPDLTNMREFGVVVEEWSVTSSDTLTTVLQTLSLATQSSCKAIAAAVKVAEKIFIPAAISYGKTQI